MANRVKRGDQINWNQVFYFSEIAAAGSVKAAAAKLGLSSSTLSEHLGQLEADLNIQLFQRQHRKITLTDEGARLFHSARQMFESGKRFIDVMSPTPLGSSPISVGIVPGSSYSFAHNVIRKYLQAHSDVSAHVLRYQHAELEAALLAGELDFGFTDRRSDRKDIVQTPLVTSDLRFFVSSDLPKQDLRHCLQSLPLVICRSDRSVPSAIEEVLDSLDLTPKTIVVSEYPSLVEHLCRTGAGVAVLGRVHFAKDPSVRLLRLPQHFPNFAERLYVSWATAGENLEAVRRLKPLLVSKV